MTVQRLSMVRVYAFGYRWERWPIEAPRWLANTAQLAQLLEPPLTFSPYTP